MSRHESVTDEFVAELRAGFLQEAERVKNAPDWQETQRRMVTGTYPFKIAIDRVDEGWTREEISNELGIRTAFGKMPNPIKVIGGRRIDEDIERGTS